MSKARSIGLYLNQRESVHLLGRRFLVDQLGAGALTPLGGDFAGLSSGEISRWRPIRTIAPANGA